MGTRLVTVATFDQVVRAQIAADALRDAGIDAVVTDAEIVSMDWLLSSAVGGIKVQVRDEDAGRAVDVLNRAHGGDGGEERAAEPGEEDSPPADEPDTEEAPPPPPADSRDDSARRLPKAAVFGLLFPPIWFFAVYLFLNAALGGGTLSDTGRNKLFLGTAVLALGFPAVLFFLSFLVFA